MVLTAIKGRSGCSKLSFEDVIDDNVKIGKVWVWFDEPEDKFGAMSFGHMQGLTYVGIRRKCSVVRFFFAKGEFTEQEFMELLSRHKYADEQLTV